jgi:hypothetical protein
MKGTIMNLNLANRPLAAGRGGAVAADLENLAAELTEAAFPVALKRGLGREWLDVKLELWSAMTHTVQNWKSSLSC